MLDGDDAKDARSEVHNDEEPAECRDEATGNFHAKVARANLEEGGRFQDIMVSQ